MTERSEVIATCLELPGVFEDYPFDDANWTVMRHGATKRSFAYIYAHEGRIWVNVKAEPMAVVLWQQIFPAVVPAYHMNKEHWVSIILDGSMTEDEVMRLVRDSYRITQPRAAKKKPRPADEA